MLNVLAGFGVNCWKLFEEAMARCLLMNATNEKDMRCTWDQPGVRHWINLHNWTKSQHIAPAGTRRQARSEHDAYQSRSTCIDVIWFAAKAKTAKLTIRAPFFKVFKIC